MTKYVTILLLGMSAISYAQPKIDLQEEAFTCESSFRHLQLGSSSRVDVTTYGKTLLPSNKEYSLQLLNEISSKKGKHYMFEQTYLSVPIANKFIKVNCRNDGMVQSTFRSLTECTSVATGSFPDSTASVDLIRQQYLHGTRIKSTRSTYIERNNTLYPAIEVYFMPGPDAYRRAIVVGKELVINQDLIEHFDSDTLIHVQVFQPDPLTTSGNVYGGAYVDNNDLDASSLNNERIQDTCTGNHNGSVFQLSNPFVVLQEHSPPVTSIPSLAGDSFFYIRSESGFEDVNAFYHITRFKQHVNKLGYTNLLNYQIRVDAHGLNGADNSTYNAGPFPPELTFGEGGVDDAEDADVIVHEYSHALSFDAAPNTNTGTERRNLDEANCDYLATSYSRNINPFSWENVYTWDGHNQYWTGRSAVTSKNYQSVTFSGNIYEHTDLWCGTLMELWSDLGRTLNDEILIESLFGYAPGMNMQDAAHLFIQADSNLYGGANYWKICPRFFNRGFISSCTTLGVQDHTNSNSFGIISIAGSNEAIIQHWDKEDWKLSVMDIHGRIIEKHTMQSTETKKKCRIQESGLYIFHCVNSTTTSTYKILIINN